MGKKLELVKENEKSDIYENDDYKVRVKQVNGGFYVKNGDKKNPCWDSDKEDDDLVWIDNTVILEAENKHTGKKSQKRCYQGSGAINDFQDALDGKSSKFSDVLKKIDS